MRGKLQSTSVFKFEKGPLMENHVRRCVVAPFAELHAGSGFAGTIVT
jgi:hypothetical protein